MFGLLERLEAMGRAGAVVALQLGAAFAIAGLGVVWWWATLPPDASGHGALAMLGLAFTFGIAAMAFGLVGAKAWSGAAYPHPTEVFPALPRAEFVAAMYAEPRPLVACSECRIHLPAAFDTGGCPRCGSSVAWLRVETDEDAELVVLSLPD